MPTFSDSAIKTLTGIDLVETRQMVAVLQQEQSQIEFEREVLIERMADLELALEDANWMRLAMDSGEFSRSGLQKITDLARMMYVKNPLVKRSVMVKTLYVWAQGVTVRAKDPDINQVIQNFWDDEKNRAELTSHQARSLKEVDLEVDGNIFFVFFTRPTDGRVRVRSIPLDEIADIVCDVNDAKSPWFYLRQWSEVEINPATGRKKTIQRKAYYPDWKYNPVSKQAALGKIEIRWESPIYHVKTGGFSAWKFGLSEIYASIDWARAYKEFLEDWASLTRSYSKFAWRMTTKGGAKGVAASKAKLASTLGKPGVETNPAPATGSTFIGAEGIDMQPMQLRGANVNAEDGRRMLLMVAASSGLPETYFGDVSVGTLATARSMDRPTELMMVDRQQVWTDILRDIINYVIFQSANSTSGLLRKKATVTTTPDGAEYEYGLAWNKGVNTMLDIDFPPILEHDIQAAVQAVVTALTLNGQSITLLDIPTATRLILKALGEDDVDEIMTSLFPDETASVSNNQTASEARVERLAKLLLEAMRKHG